MVLPESFYARPVAEVAEDLVGRHIERGKLVLRITEVEAYGGPDDTASHARFAARKRNDVMWGPPGRAYVYLCYGIHNMFNIVTDAEGTASAVLVRSCEPVAGLREIRRRRGDRDGPVLLTGPGKIGQVLRVDPSWSGRALYRSGPVRVLAGDPDARVVQGPRVGIEFAARADRVRAWRFASADSKWVSHRKTLKRRPAG